MRAFMPQILSIYFICGVLNAPSGKEVVEAAVCLYDDCPYCDITPDNLNKLHVNTTVRRERTGAIRKDFRMEGMIKYRNYL